jgi:hypothetical protein
MEQSPSLEVNRYLASQEIRHILWTSMIHYRINKTSPPFPFLIQIKPIRASIRLLEDLF